jgi:phosphatidylglycerol---prolipoprotein diacylglyceryl transferase
MLRSFVLFGIKFHTYPIATLFGVVIGLLLGYLFVRKEGYSTLLCMKLGVAIVLGFFVGARLLNVFLNFSYYKLNPGAVFQLELKGFSVCGGVILAVLMCLLVLKRNRKDFYRFFDLASIPFLVSFALMKFGCFLNGCCGGHITKSCLGIVFPSTASSDPAKMLEFLSGLLMLPKKVLPTQLFEAGLALLFVPFVILIFRRKNYFYGKVFAFTAIYFASMRLFVHFFRVFPYPPIVVNVVYPLFYLAIIGTAVFWLYKKI